MQDNRPRWVPGVDEYVLVRRTGEIGLVAGVGVAGGTTRFLVRVYPQAEAGSPHTHRLVAASVLCVLYRLDDLAPDPTPPPGRALGYPR